MLKYVKGNGMKIGIYGGSFNPVHKEHIDLARSAVKSLGLERLIVVPAATPPHKLGQTILCGEDRLNMLKLAFDGEPRIEVSDYELLTPGPSYTYLTVEHFKKIFDGAEVYFLVGTDMLEDFPTWKNPQRILASARLFVTPREGEDIASALDKFKKAFPGREDSVVVSDYPGKDISSSRIRFSLYLGLDTSPYLTDDVRSYIEENELYSGGAICEFLQKNLPISRLIHTRGVMLLAKKYAKRLGVDVERAVFAAMVHDVAKRLDKDDYPGFKVDGDVPKGVIHQFLGAYVLKELFAVTDEGVLNAVRYHTTGRPQMTLLEKIVFIADLLEEGRAYDEVATLRRAVDEDFEAGFRLCVKRLMTHLTLQGGEIYSLTKACLDYYCNQK